MRVEAVFFDAGNTILYPDPPVGQVYADALREAGVRVSAVEVAGRFRETFGRLSRERSRAALRCGGPATAGKQWWRRIVWDCFEPYGPLEGFEELFEGLWDYFAGADAWRVYPDVLPTFEALRARGLRLGLISNWDVRLDAILKGLGLDEWLDHVVISHQVGVEKPHPAIFRRALALCGLKPGQALHVGDSYAEDVVGARAIGMRAVWLCRDGEAGNQADVDMPVIRSLDELPRLTG